MKKIMLGLLLALTIPAFATITPLSTDVRTSSFPTTIIRKINQLIASSASAISGDITVSDTGVAAIGAGKVTEAQLKPFASGQLNALRIAVAHYSFAVNGGAQAAIPLGVTIPANSTIIRSWIYTKTQVAGVSSTVALSCETANNIFSAASMTSIVAGTLTEGVSTGAATVFKPITAACNITATIGTANVTAGDFDVYAEYVTHD